MTEGKREIIQRLPQEYDIETAEDIQDTLKDLLGNTIKVMMEAKMDEHLGYQKELGPGLRRISHSVRRPAAGLT